MGLVKLTLKNRNQIKLKEGEYCCSQLTDIGLVSSKIIELCLQPHIEITIYTNQYDKQTYHHANNSCYKFHDTINFRLTVCSKIIVSKLCKTECEHIKWDYIIIGLGSASSILSRKLTDDHKTSVLVLEAGQNYQDDPIILSPNWINFANDLFVNPKYAISYPVPVSTLAIEVYAEGRLWGGSAAHNFLLAVRGTPRVYKRWARITGDESWSYKSLLPLMKAVETYTPYPGTPNPHPKQRGYNGPIGVTQSAPVNTDPIMQAYNEVTKTPFIPDYNNPRNGNIGISAVQQLITAGTPEEPSHRSYSNLEFLPVGEIIDADGNGLHGRKLKIISKARALHFKVDKNKKAKSVQYIHTEKNDKIERVYLKKNGTLILSAGSIQTSKFLLNSGIGPKADLEAVGIPVILDSPNVGRNLQCQYGPAAIVVGNLTVPFEAEVFWNLYPYLYPNDPAKNIRHMQIINIPLGATSFEALSVITDPKSRGSVTIVNSDPLVAPKLDIGIFNDYSQPPPALPAYEVPGTDAYAAVSFYKMIKKVATAAGQTVVYPTTEQYAGGDAALLQAAQNISVLTIQAHIVGTTRMGKTIDDGVVDSDLNVFGLKNVKVCDAGIEPYSVDGNTCLSVYYIALNLLRKLGYIIPPAL